jgi:hypothetical protein
MIDIAEKIKNIDITNLMTKRVIAITENQSLQEASKLMYQNNIGSIFDLVANVFYYHGLSSSFNYFRFTTCSYKSLSGPPPPLP